LKLALLVPVITALALPLGLAHAQEEKAGAKSSKSDHPAEASESKAESTHGADTAGHSDPKGEHASAEHAAGHHDDTDLTHGNATKNIANPADIRYDMSIYSFVVFVLLLAVLYKFAWKPIANALDLREQTIARQIEEARLASERGAAQLKEYEARLAAATEEARQIVSGARKDAEHAKEKIVAESREAAQKERDRAVADINIAKNQALDQIAQKSVQTAVSLASNIIRREVKPQEHEALIGEAVNQFSKLN
jgi:F-type H+-transporting ATPase subunit b